MSAESLTQGEITNDAVPVVRVHGRRRRAAGPRGRCRRCSTTSTCSTQKLQDQGAWVFAGGLHPANTATVVRVSNGDVLTTDGPFAEAKEQLGGFWVIEAADLDAALAWAAEATVACQAPVEVRPFQDN